VAARRQIEFALAELIQCFFDPLGALVLAHRPMVASVDSDQLFMRSPARRARGPLAPGASDSRCSAEIETASNRRRTRPLKFFPSQVTSRVPTS
jgi:hypothetical protein